MARCFGTDVASSTHNNGRPTDIFSPFIFIWFFFSISFYCRNWNHHPIGNSVTVINSLSRHYPVRNLTAESLCFCSRRCAERETETGSSACLVECVTFRCFRRHHLFFCSYQEKRKTVWQFFCRVPNWWRDNSFRAVFFHSSAIWIASDTAWISSNGPIGHHYTREMRKKGRSRRLVPTPDGKLNFVLFLIYFAAVAIVSATTARMQTVWISIATAATTVNANRLRPDTTCTQHGVREKNRILMESCNFIPVRWRHCR